MKIPGTKIQWGQLLSLDSSGSAPGLRLLKDRVEASQEPKKSENVVEKEVTLIEDGEVAEAIRDMEKEDEQSNLRMWKKRGLL